MNFPFDLPLAIALAVMLPAAVGFLVLRWHRERLRRVARMGTPDIVMRLMPPSTLTSPRWRIARLALAAVLIGVAVAGPRWGSETTVVRARGIDMVLALDASLSMLAEDDRPNRLERMKQEVRRLRDASPGDRIGVLAFAARSYILTPLTIDAGALDLFVDNLDPSVVGQAGSSLARAIKQGVDLLKLSSSGADQAIVVMSDGEAWEPIEEVEAEARRAAAEGISLVTVGFGTEQGTTIPITVGGRPALKRDENNEVVVTRYQADYLRAAAAAARGTFIEAGTADKAGEIKRALATLRTQARVTRADENRVHRYQWFLLPAFVLLLLDTLLTERRGRMLWRWRPAAAKTAAAAMALVSLSACSLFLKDRDAVEAYRDGDYANAAALFRQAAAGGNAGAPTLYNLGTALVSADSLQPAIEVLDPLTSDEDAELRYRSTFNLGLAHLERGLAPDSGSEGEAALDAALSTYKRALLMRSPDVDAKWNYELALHRRSAGGGGGGGGGGGAESQPSPSRPEPRPSGGLGQREAEQLLASAAREEHDVQAKQQRQNRIEPPPGGKDW